MSDEEPLWIGWSILAVAMMLVFVVLFLVFLLVGDVPTPYH